MKGIDLETVPQFTKRCRTCEQRLDLDLFGSHKGHRDGKQNSCKPCRNALNRNLLTPEQVERKRANAGVRYWSDREGMKVRRRGWRYPNFTPEMFEWMLAEQGGVCKICHQTETYEHRTLCVDHDHLTGAVRGLLCTRCNKALGGFFDSIELLQSAIEYLARVEVRQEEIEEQHQDERGST